METIETALSRSRRKASACLFRTEQAQALPANKRRIHRPVDVLQSLDDRTLSQLGMGPSFDLLSSGLLRCSVQSQLYCEIGSVDGYSERKLRFLPEAFDPQSRQVTLSQCSFTIERGASAAGGATTPGASQNLSTNVTIGLGEWVVLGSVGSEATLIALRVETVAPPAPAPAAKPRGQ